MADILLKASSFILVIFVGIMLKAKGVCTREEGKFLSRVVLNITLPCSILSSVHNVEITPVLVMTMLIGIGVNLITNFIGFTLSKGDKPLDRGVSMINTSGFNVGAFALPFIQSVFPASDLIYICMFDMGNSFMCVGGTYAIASMVAASEDKRPSVKELAKKLFSSVPLCTYLILLVLALLKIPVPEPILTVTSIGAKANPFLAMLVIGILLELKFDTSEKKMLKRILIGRYTFAISAALAIYFLLPVDLIVRKMLVIGLLAPVSSAAPIFSTRLGSDSPVPAAINSITIIVSTIVLTVLMVLFV